MCWEKINKLSPLFKEQVHQRSHVNPRILSQSRYIPIIWTNKTFFLSMFIEQILSHLLVNDIVSYFTI